MASRLRKDPHAAIRAMPFQGLRPADRYGPSVPSRCRQLSRSLVLYFPTPPSARQSSHCSATVLLSGFPVHILQFFPLLFTHPLGLRPAKLCKSLPGISVGTLLELACFLSSSKRFHRLGVGVCRHERVRPSEVLRVGDFDRWTLSGFERLRKELCHSIHHKSILAPCSDLVSSIACEKRSRDPSILDFLEASGRAVALTTQFSHDGFAHVPPSLIPFTRSSSPSRGTRGR